MRLAWWSPWPPQRSGIAGRSAELVPLLSARGHAVDVYVDAGRVRVPAAPDVPPAPGAWRVLNAHEFLWRQAKGHYDLSVYQLGNSHLHKYIWPYLFKYPGLAVLHDARLHHARAEALLSAGRRADYRTEFAWSHPQTDAAAANFALLGVDGVFFYQWPMIRGVLETSRAVAVHSRGIVTSLQAEWPDQAIEHIALGEGRGDLDAAEAGRSFRRAHDLPADAVVFGVFGGLTFDKRVPEILAAFQATRAWLPDARLLLAGAADPWLGLADRIAHMRLADAVLHLPASRDDEFDNAIAASDIVLNLRWPTALETSGPWVRSLALGRPTVIFDLPHYAHVPALDPRTWHRQSPCDDLSDDADDRAVTVAIDLRDVNRLLRVTMQRLATDRALRNRLGAAARRWWEREHTVDRMVEDYERVLRLALERPAPAVQPDWPAHLVPVPAAHVRELVGGDVWRNAVIAERLSTLDS